MDPNAYRFPASERMTLRDAMDLLRAAFDKVSDTLLLSALEAKRGTQFEADAIHTQRIAQAIGEWINRIGSRDVIDAHHMAIMITEAVAHVERPLPVKPDPRTAPTVRMERNPVAGYVAEGLGENIDHCPSDNG
jgi:hypothetical protein